MIRVDEDVASDGTFETARTYVQNWRHDVVAMLSPSGTVLTSSKQDYTSYGEPLEIWSADISKDGVVDIVDFGALGSSFNKSVGDAGLQKSSAASRLSVSGSLNGFRSGSFEGPRPLGAERHGPFPC